MTVQQVKDLHYKQQVNPDKIEKIPANCAKEINEKYFKDVYTGYKINAYEKDFYHIVQEIRTFKKNTDIKTSKPSVLKLNKAMFKKMKETNGFKGLATYILHNPELSALKSTKDSINDTGDDEFDYQASADMKKLKAFYTEITGEEAVKNWSIDKTKEQIREFLES